MFSLFKNEKPRSIISFADFALLVDIILRSSGSRLLFYAHLGGYLGNTTIQDHADFLDKLQAEWGNEAFPGTTYAFDFLIDGLNYQLAKEHWPTFRKFFENEPEYDEVLQIVSRWPKEGIHPKLEPDNQRWLQYVIDKVLEKREIDHNTIRALVRRKWPVLRPILSKALREGVDKWGEQTYDAYFRECVDFSVKFILESDIIFYTPEYTWRVVEQISAEFLASEHSPSIAVSEVPIDGVGFEHWCAEQLERQGWMVQLTKASGDQGADLIARKGTASVAIQCKRYSSPVGNKAVQEIYAGQINELCDYACVIATGGFTRAAHQLAHATKVRLLDASDIAAFDESYPST